jgi:hypothetical protein
LQVNESLPFRPAFGSFGGQQGIRSVEAHANQLTSTSHIVMQSTFSKPSRRQFLGGTLAGAASLTAFPTWGKPIGANGDVRVAVIGFKSRGKGHIGSLLKIPGCAWWLFAMWTAMSWTGRWRSWRRRTSK